MSHPTVKYLSVRGETLPMRQWAKLTGLSYYVLYQRIERGWTDEEAVTLPLQARPDRLPVLHPRNHHKKAVRYKAPPAQRFEVGQLPRWGSCVSVSWRISP